MGANTEEEDFNNSIVRKSKSLMFFKGEPFTVMQMKLLDIYLSKIDAKDPNQTKVILTKYELGKILGVTRQKVERVERDIEALMRPVTIREDHGWVKVVLFSCCRCTWDEDGGKWMIELACSPEAKKYFFGLQDIGYLRYRIRNMVQLNSSSSMYLFLYLVNNQFRKTWSVPLDEFREQIHCEDETYQDFRKFNQKVLKKSVNDVNEKTDLSVSYVLVKEKKKVVAIKFTVTGKSLHEIIEVWDKEDSSALSQTIIQIMQMLDLNDSSDANTIYLKGTELGLSDDEIIDKVRYVSQKDNIDNVVGYALSIMDKDIHS